METLVSQNLEWPLSLSFFIFCNASYSILGEDSAGEMKDVYKLGYLLKRAYAMQEHAFGQNLDSYVLGYCFEGAVFRVYVLFQERYPLPSFTKWTILTFPSHFSFYSTAENGLQIIFRLVQSFDLKTMEGLFTAGIFMSKVATHLAKEWNRIADAKMH